MAAPLTAQKYEELWAAWLQVQTIGHVQRTCGVAFGTVRRYVKEGDPSRGLEPLGLRFSKLQSKLRERHDYTWTTAATGTLDLTRRVKEICKRQLDGLKKNKSGEFRDPIRAIEVAHKLEALIMGEPTDHHLVTADGDVIRDDPFAGSSDEEVMEFLREALPALESYGFGAKANGHEPADPNRLVDTATVLQ